MTYIVYQFFIFFVYVASFFLAFFSETARKRLFFRVKDKAYDICVHATSIGEATLALNISRELFAQKKIFISTSTKKSYRYLLEKIDGNEWIDAGYLPIDVYWNSYFFVKNLNFSSLFVIEHDMWPNLLKICAKLGVKRYLLNAYIKKKDFRNFLTYPRVVPLLFNFDEIYAQSSFVQRQLKRMSIASHIPIKSVGNFKYMQGEKLEPFHLDGMREKIVVLGSFHDGEERIWMDEVGSPNGEYTLVIIPRRLDLVEKWFCFFKRYGKTQIYSRYRPEEETDFLIVDAWGLSRRFYSLARFVVIGDSFKPTMGGHNVVEPLFFLKPVVYGKYLRTFPDITRKFEKEKIFYRASEGDLLRVCRELLLNDHLYESLQGKIQIELESIALDKRKLSFMIDIFS